MRLQRSTNVGAPALAQPGSQQPLERGASTSSQDLNQIPPDWLDEMEVYVGAQVPIQYSGLNPCGVDLLWTRR